MASFRVPFYAILVWQLFVFLSFTMVMISRHLPLVFKTEIASFHLSLLFNVSIFMLMPNALRCCPLLIFIFAAILQRTFSMFFYSISRWSFFHVPLVCNIVWASPFHVPVLSSTVRASSRVRVLSNTARASPFHVPFLSDIAVASFGILLSFNTSMASLRKSLHGITLRTIVQSVETLLSTRRFN